MSQKTIVVVGAGPGLGLAIGRRFGRAGFNVALMARNAERVEELAAELRNDGIEAAGFAGDVTNEAATVRAFAAVRARFGGIDVLEFSPMPPALDPKFMSPAAVTAEAVRVPFDLQVIGAINVLQQVLPEMKARQSGTVLITTGGSSHFPVPFITATGMAMAACRNYALCLSAELAPQGIFVASVAIGTLIKAGDPDASPEKIAETYFDVYQKRDRSDVLIQATGDALKELQQQVSSS
jgi:NAD(P)-dependent dehydrogenase (short-subunit alcohol dehydrogenase family)